MYNHFFPNFEFAWAFCLILVFGLGIIAVKDLRTAKIPNNLSMSLFVLGLILNMVRGGWLATQEVEVWQFGQHGVAVGVLDAFLFSIVGFLVAFALYLLMWIMGACGGGDVKLMAAIGGWVGAYNICLLVPLTVFTVLIWVVFKVLAGGWQKTIQENREQRKALGTSKPLPKGRLTFSVPALAAVVLLLLWTYRFDLHLAEQPEKSHATASYRLPS